jgi:hypothetical protein
VGGRDLSSPAGSRSRSIHDPLAWGRLQEPGNRLAVSSHELVDAFQVKAAGFRATSVIVATWPEVFTIADDHIT